MKERERERERVYLTTFADHHCRELGILARELEFVKWLKGGREI
jgi:hypothetical protein